jgi:alpha-L-arabinofuranosidase
MRMSIFKKIVLSGLLVSGTVAFADTQVVIDASTPGPVINKNVYGQFAEHLGRGIYEGLWVGPESKIPNTRGWRNDVVGALKDIKVPLVRWPGGCFADEYHWREGIGPRDKRPVKVNTNWGGVEENNAVGTHEFFDLVEMLGADAYVNGNLGSGTPQEMAEWLEYMTAEGKSSLAELRRKNGRDKPFRVHYFAVGNESWGCGGNMTAEFYTHLYKQYATFLKAPKHNSPKLIAVGANDMEPDWTATVAGNIKQNWSLRVEGISFHYYTLPTGNWKAKGAATGFPESEWFSTFQQTLRMDGFLEHNLKALEKADPEKKIGFYVDEWGTWYDVEKGANPGFLYQQNSLRDALVAAVNFNIFHKYAERVHMTNIAQMVNVLQAMILTDKDKMILTPTYYAFKMYVPFQDSTSLPVNLTNQPNYKFNDSSIPTISVSAAKAKDGKVYLAVTNLNPQKSENLKISTKGMTVKKAKGQILTSEKMDAHNTFASPNNISPASYAADAKDGQLTLSIPAKSVVVVALE